MYREPRFRASLPIRTETPELTGSAVKQEKRAIITVLNGHAFAAACRLARLASRAGARGFWPRQDEDTWL